MFRFLWLSRKFSDRSTQVTSTNQIWNNISYLRIEYISGHGALISSTKLTDEIKTKGFCLVALNLIFIAVVLVVSAAKKGKEEETLEKTHQLRYAIIKWQRRNTFKGNIGVCNYQQMKKKSEEEENMKKIIIKWQKKKHDFISINVYGYSILLLQDPVWQADRYSCPSGWT